MFIVMLNMKPLIFNVRENIYLKTNKPKLWISMGKFFGKTLLQERGTQGVTMSVDW